MSLNQQQIQQLRPRPAPWVDDNSLISQVWYGWLKSLHDTLNANAANAQSTLGNGLTVTITTAKLTTTGTNGSMTFTNGVLTAQTPAT